MIQRRGLPILVLAWLPLSACHLAKQADLCQDVASTLKGRIGPGAFAATAEPEALRKAASAYREVGKSLEPLRASAPRKLVTPLAEVQKSVRELDDQLVRAATSKEQNQQAVYRNLKRQIEANDKRLKDAVTGLSRACRGS
jgi:hypothetical protein